MGESNLRDGLVTPHENFGVVLVQSTLVVTNSWHVLDDNGVVGVFSLLVEHRVGLNHVINDVGLGDLLGAELLLGAQVLAIVVTEMVVAGNGGQLDTGVDQEVNQSRLHLGLARLEVIATNEGVVLLSELDSAWNKGVLRRAVDEWHLLKDTGNSEDGGRRDFLVTVLDGLQEVLSGIIDTLDDVGVTLGVGSPEDNDLVKSILGLELLDIIAEVLNVLVASLASLDDVVGTILLVGSNEVRVVDAGKRDHLSHLLPDLGLQGRLKDSSTVHGVSQVHGADIPAAQDQVIGVDHGEDIVEWDVDLLGGLSIGTQLHGGTHDHGAVVVGSALALAGVPGQTLAVGENASGNGGTIVTTPPDEHDTGLGNTALDLEVIESLLGRGDVLALGSLLYGSSAVSVLGLDLGVRVGDIGRVDGEELPVGARGSDRMTIPVREARSNLCVWCHFDRGLG